MKPDSLSVDNWLAMAEPEVENDTAAEEVLRSTAETEGAAVNDRSEDLMVFFSIGVIVNILLVAAFLAWAIGQWRKTKK